MEQTKALNALEPFLALSKSATSPRAAADLVSRATAAPNTFLFAELLQTSAAQALAESPDHTPYLLLLQVFSYGTYETYQNTNGLPPLDDAQTVKLRQLSLMTLAKDRQNLTYEAIQKALGLASTRQVEELVVSAIYAGLLHATLDPAGAKVNVSSVAPLRDLAPDSIPSLITALRTWSDRCTSTLADLDDQIKSIRAAATVRQRDERATADQLSKIVNESRDREAKHESSSRDAMSRRAFGKRMAEGGAETDESMDVDEPYVAEEEKRASKRKIELG